MPAKDRPAAMAAAAASFGPKAVDRLMRSECPRCGSADKRFRDDISKKEHSISGLCQLCQDIIFATGASEKDDD